MHLLLGSIGVLAETSELQRNSYNMAFRTSGLDWYWDTETYRRLLQSSGGVERLRTEARRRDATINAAEIHQRKERIFQSSLALGISLRPGVGAAIVAARASGGRIGLVTTTSASNVQAVLDATALSQETFDCVIDRCDVSRAKPHPDAYRLALSKLRLEAEEVLAVEDNPMGFQAARAAGLATVAFPSAMHVWADFPGAVAVQAELDIAVRRAA